MLRQLLYGVPPVEEKAFIAVDEGDAALARSRVGVRRVVGDKTEVVVRRLDLAQLDSGNRGNILDKPAVEVGVGARQSAERESRLVVFEEPYESGRPGVRG